MELEKLDANSRVKAPYFNPKYLNFRSNKELSVQFLALEQTSFLSTSEQFKVNQRVHLKKPKHPIITNFAHC